MKKRDSGNLIHDFEGFVASRVESCGGVIFASPAYMAASHQAQMLFEKIKAGLRKALGEKASRELLCDYDSANGFADSLEAWNLYKLGFRDGLDLAGLLRESTHSPALMSEDYERDEEDEDEPGRFAPGESFSSRPNAAGDEDDEGSPHVAAIDPTDPELLRLRAMKVARAAEGEPATVESPGEV